MNTLIIIEAVLIIKGETTVQLRISAVLLRKAGRWDVPYAPIEQKLMLTDDILQDLTQENVVFQKEYTRQVYDTKSIITNGSPLKDSSVTYLKIKKGRDCTG